jgi:alpha-tubulin suppressor-like RCC1 family protein
VTALGTDVVEATLGDSHYCARKREGSVWCWGSNNYGSLGADPIDNGWTPGRVTALGTGVSAISAGDGHTCAIVMDATLCCWGSNFLGALGNGTTVASSVPVRATVLGNAQVARVSAGGYGYTCAATTDGALWCWGHNEDGQLGDGTTMDSVTAVRPSIPCP